MNIRNNQIKHVIIHLGMSKTATTSIQETLFKNKMPPDYIHKYYYPKSLGSNHGIAFTKMFIDTYDLNILPFGTNPDFRDENIIHKKILYNELQNHSFETLVISGESLATGSQETLVKLKQLFLEIFHSKQITFSIVVYVRDFIAHYTSLLQHIIRKHYISSSDYDRYFELFLNSENLAFTLQKCINVFETNDIQVFKFEDAILHPYGPVGFFYDKVLNFKIEDIGKLNIKKNNDGCSQIAIDICQFINDTEPMYNNECTALSGKRTLGDLSLFYKITGEKFKLEKMDRLYYLDKGRSQINQFNNTFGFKYSLDAMRFAIENDTEPCHIPSEKNIEEIDAILCKLDPILQNCVIRYLRTF